MAETFQNKRRIARRALWALAALGSVAVGIAYSVLRSRHSRPEREQEPSVTTPPEKIEQDNPATAFEPTDWSLRPLALIYLAIPVLLVISCFALIAAYPNALPDVDRTLHITPPGPRLQTDAAGDLQRFRADEERRLNTYYWIDREKGIVHIPIDEAMKKLATMGAPGFPKGQP